MVSTVAMSGVATWYHSGTSIGTSVLNLLTIFRCSYVVPQWDKYWHKCIESANKAKKDVSILTALVKCFGLDYMWSSILYFIYSLLLFVSPQVVNLIIGFVQSNEEAEPLWRGYLYVSVIILTTIVNSVINAQYWYIQWLIGLRVRTALTSAIYRKSLKLSNKAKKEMTVGETTNLMSIDTQKFMDLVLYLNMIWSSPLQIILCLYFLWGILGPSSLAGLAVMVLMIPINSVVGDKMKAYQKEQMANKDIRTKLMDEVLNGIKVLKLYAWEPSFSLKILDIRRGEIKSLKKVAYMNAFTTFLWTCAPFLVAVSSFTVYVLIDENNILDAQTAFVSLTYFNLLRAPLNFLPALLVYLIQCAVSLKRVNKFMNSEELDPLNVTHDNDFNHPVYAEHADFTWENEADPSLKDITLRIDEGSLVAVVGQVGSGKSSILSALLGEMKRTKGVVNVRGKVAYTSQQAWIQNGTLQDNIIFGKRLNKDLYERVIDACALKPDIEMLPGGDQIEIGEKGINLSGGQKQRVSIARSVYSNSNVYFLDDPLSAVDAHVGKHIFEKVIGPKGILRNKTRVLVTHAINYLPRVDKIVVMNEGRITETGTYKELLNKKGDFADFLVQFLSNNEKMEDPETESELNEIKSNLESTIGKKKLERRLSKARSDKSTVISAMSAITTLDAKSGSKEGKRKRFTSTSQMSEHMVEVRQVGQDLIETERLEEGGVKLGVYKYYAESVGMFAFTASIMFYIIYQGFSVGANIWLSRWADDTTSNITSVRNKYLAVYGTLGVLQSLSIMFATTVFAIFTLDAATKLHDTMLMRIIKAPMSFFDTTPTGRMLNRFSKDIDILDTTIPMNFRMLFNQSLNVLGTVFVVVFAMPVFILVVIPIAVVYYFIQKFYVATARQVKRMESISRSPIYNHFSETITGASTIRAFNRTENFVLENERRVDENQICYYPAIVSNRWLGIRLELIGNIFIMAASIFAVATRGTIDPGLVGLSLSYALNVSTALSMLVRISSDVETNMVSVERIQEYQTVALEAPFSLPENDPHAGWPEYGVIKFDNYQTRYREGLDLVLKGLSCEIKSGEKVGIVGRTGAGKSSLTLALFRIIEAASGNITIDGVNIKHLGLGKLRSRITIIPQDPVLFAGSLKMNLDPFEQYPDSDIWNSLDHAHLKSTVIALPGALNFQVTEGGENLSVGQRQLICLARALLRKTKVLILDEATAAVDLETDELVQSTIREEFKDCTVITIAHRLNTIMDSNRVMVLDKGQIAEFDSPSNLLADTKSIFYGMAKSGK